MIKKAIGFIAAAMAATITYTAHAEGAIRSIDPCDEYGNVISAGSVENALTVGAKAYFRILLLNENAETTYENRGNAVAYQNPWKFVQTDSLQDAAVQWYSARPAVGVFVSGKLKFAEVVQQPTVLESAPWYSQMICCYTVEPGDLAFPMLLADDSGAVAVDNNNKAYRLKNARPGLVGQPWQLVCDRRVDGDWNTVEERVEVDFKYGTSYPEATPIFNSQDYTLLQAGIFIQTIDFDNNFEAEDSSVWRYTHERYTGTDKYVPALAIPGSEISTNVVGGKVYIWSGDTNTVALPDAKLIGTNMVLTIDLDGDAESLKFRIRGVNKGQTSLYLSSTPTNITYKSGETIVNYVTTTVECLDPLPPTVQVLVNDSTDQKLNALSDYQNSVAPFEINLTQAWTNDEAVTVKLTYKVNDVTVDPTNLVAISYRQANGYADELPTEIVIPAGETSSSANLSNPRFIYALGALTSTAAGGDKVEIIPSFEDAEVAEYYKTVEPCVITLCGMTPVVSQVDEYAVSETADSETLTPCIEVRGGILHEYQVYLADDYRDMKGLATNSYTVIWSCDGKMVEITEDDSGNPLKVSAEGVLKVPYTFAVSSADRTVLTTLTVRDASGNRSAARSFYVKVKMPKSISASVGATVVGEGSKLPVTFTLTEPSDISPVYVFLEPANEAATNNTAAPFFTMVTKDGVNYESGTGIAIGSGETEVLSTALSSGNTLEILDNASDVFTYNVRLCEEQKWNAAKEVKDFTSRVLTITATNNAPVIKQVLSRNTGTGLDKNTSSMITMCLTDPARTFRVSSLVDVDADKNGKDEKQLVYRWAVYMQDASTGNYPSVPNMVIYKVGLDSLLSTVDIFQAAQIPEEFCGTYKFSVRAQDKDMRGVKPEYLWEENGEWKYSPERPGYGYEGAWQEFPENLGNDWGDEYTFELKIDKNPYIEAMPHGTYAEDNNGYPVFTEKDLITGENIGFWVGLNAKPNISGFASIPVEIVIEPVDSDAAVNPQITPEKFTFTATVYSNKFNFTDFDGNWVGKGVSKLGALYKLTARVPDTATGSIDGTPMYDYFEECVTHFRVQNSAPIVSVDEDYVGQDSETNALTGITYAPNERFNFRWSVSDVTSDLSYTEHGTSNLIVTCMVVGGHEIGVVSNQSSGVFSVWFDKPGINKLKISATDKDGDTGHSQIVYFFVETSKNVFIYPSGPANNTESQSMQAYISAGGRGVGAVWADGNFGSIKSYMHTWTYGPSARTAKVFAWGYPAGHTDTATYSGKSIAMKTDGTDTGDTPFTNESKYDSFFYRWFLKLYKEESSSSGSSGSEEATWTGEYPNPQVGKARSDGSNASQKGITLPSTEVNYTYGDTWAMAIFSRELFETDNLGDMNLDGIPDYFAVKAWSTTTGEAKTIPELKTKNAITSGGEGEGEKDQSVTASDLADIADYVATAGEVSDGENAEGDTSAVALDAWGWRYWGGSHRVQSWGNKVEFTAYDKIRGFGQGLNFRPGTVSDWDLADNEKLALIADYVAAGNALAPASVDKVDGEGNKVQKVDDEGNPVVDGDGNPVYEQVAQDVLEATLTGGAYAWAVANNWSCEPQMFDMTDGGKNLNPAVLDTDGDGFADAWEYFFWYYAKAGAVVDGKWMRMTGSRFSLAALGAGETIPAEEIAAAFHPGVKRASLSTDYDVLDFDGDGLSDIEEYVLGTNPVHWDSDGDGISDFYEILNATDPLSDTDGNRLLGAASFGNNPDRDFMAWCDYSDWKVVTFENGQKFATPVQSEITLVSTLGEEDTATQYALATVDDGTKAGAVYYVEPTAADYVYAISDKEFRLAKDVEAWKRFQWPDTLNPGEEPQYWLSSKSVTLAAGTVLKSAINAADLVDGVPAKVGDWKVWEAELGEMVSTNCTLRLFVYGTEDAVGPSGQKGVLVAAGMSLASTTDFPSDKKVVNVEAGKVISLIHNQVFVQDGFDPRVAWHKNAQGYVSSRWSTVDTVSKGDKAGFATNTVPYSTLDEYLVMQYRYEALKLGIADDIVAYGAEKRCDLKGDQDALLNGSRTLYDIIRKNSTVAADSLEFVYTNSAGVVTEYDVRGADTDEDGVPDGWELYVKADPNWADDASLTDLNIFDQDGLNMLTEFSGTDSCAAYSNRYDSVGELVYEGVESIVKNGPWEKNSAIYGWYNKFFPTDPFSVDTDEDGIVDGDEGSSRTGKFYVGRNEYEAKFTFIYGTEDGVATDNGTSKCIRGGGLNPCTVDTDMDLLPDGWEYEFAGVVVDKGSCSVKLSDVDAITLLSADGLQEAYSNTTTVIRGGMDGTFADDSNYDFDHDGLLNFQEYLVQSLRHLRYDDSETPLMGRYIGPTKAEKHGPFVPMQAWDGDAFHDTVKAAGYGASSAFKYRELGYFTLPPKPWDRLSFAGTGLAGQVDSTSVPGYRIMLRPYAKLKTSTAKNEVRFEFASENSSQGGKVYNSDFRMYASTDPRQWDSDGDGMDDYYELFHGLNPLLGSVANPYGSDQLGHPNICTYDRIAMIYAEGTDLSGINAWCNAWTGWNEDAAPEFDAVKYPWMMGTAECDADGDSIRNADEALLVNVTSPTPSHTDPTPLWFTDSSNADNASYVSQYYRMPMVPGATGSELLYYPWLWNDLLIVYDPAMDGRSKTFMFAFEENEGFDTDRDGMKDATEQTLGVSPASDPLKFDDPDRRQALWLDGEKSAAVTYNGGYQRAFSTQYDLLRQFTVECWVKSEALGEQVILERVSDYSASTLSNCLNTIRANFRLGIDASGRFYGEYQGSTEDSASPRVTDAVSRANDGQWHHLALTYSGSVLSLYVDGNPTPVNVITDCEVIPANGIMIMRQEAGSDDAVLKYGYMTQPCAFIVGASALTATSLSLTPATEWTGFGSFYKGYVDEIRVWDGARTGEEIKNTYKNRFSFEDVKDMRAKEENGGKSGIYYEWLAGARRNNTSSKVLSAELIQHYNFQSLPGATGSVQVLDQGLPVGFRRGVTDNVRKDGISIDAAIQCGWWANTPVHSEVYNSYLAVPWIQNTCAHLPPLDGSAVDSMYWSESCSGMNRASISGSDKFYFPNSANPYPYYYFNLDKWVRLLRLDALSYSVVNHESDGEGSNAVTSVSYDNEYTKAKFQLRSDFVGTSDLVPLGNAFAKRASDFWDGHGAMDAWAMTGTDSDEDGIPDWAEALGYNTLEAYLRALAAGLMPDGNIDAGYKSVADLEYDGIPDWWQKMYGLKGEGNVDSDNDGLSDAAEYLISDVFKFAQVNPLVPMTDGKELDYFRTQGKMYLGGMFSDHDFLEDWWELLYDNKYVSIAYFDTFSDNDEDGWSNWAEARAGTSPARKAYLGVDQMTIADYPVPTVELKLTSKSVRNTSGSPVVVKAYSERRESTVPDASWVIGVKNGNSDTLTGDAVDRQKMIGMNPNKEISLTLGPGSVVVGTVQIGFKAPVSYFKNAYIWNGNGSEWVFSSEYCGPSRSQWVDDIVFDKARAGDTVYGDIVYKVSTEAEKVIGKINYQTGEVTIDLAQLQGVYTWGDIWDMEAGYHRYYEAEYLTSYVKVNWQSVVPNQGYPMTVYLADSEESTDSHPNNGHVLEGKNTFTAFIDLNGDGQYTDGEPFGMAKGVDVGWNSAKAEIELTDESPIAPRMTVLLSTNATSKMYVYRYGVDGLQQPSSIAPRLVRELEVGERKFFNEADFLADGEFDLDWTHFQKEVMNDGTVYGYDLPVTSVTYRVYSQPVNIHSEAQAATNALPFVEFSRDFGAARARAIPADAEDSTAVFYGSCPTFRWKMSGDMPESFTAFAIQVKDSAGTVVWNSGKRFAPVRDSDGYYAFTAPLYVGDQTSLGKILENQVNYTWSVSMYNSKYQSDSWSTARAFRMNVYASDEVNTAGYGQLNVAVKYFGPGVVDTDTEEVASKIRVEAYATPDFSGMPVGRAIVMPVYDAICSTEPGYVSLTNDEHCVNAVIRGIPPGTYYVRAYLDTDGDFTKSDWESWGYACYRGSASVKAGFTVADITVATGTETPTALVYIEDTDVDRDALPDVYEYDTAGTSKTDFLLKKGPVENENNGYIQVNPDLEDSIRDLIDAGYALHSISASGMSSSLVALSLGVNSVLPEVEANTVRITSLALEGETVKLTVAADATDNSSLLSGSGIFVPVQGGEVTVTVVVKHAASLDGDWGETSLEKTFVIEEGAVSDTFEFPLSDFGLTAEQGFFKVEIKQ